MVDLWFIVDWSSSLLVWEEGFADKSSFLFRFSPCLALTSWWLKAGLGLIKIRFAVVPLRKDATLNPKITKIPGGFGPSVPRS